MLPPQLLQQMRRLMDAGDMALDADNYAGAISRYQEAAELIPQPRETFEVSLEIFGAMGEAYFFAGDYRNAISWLRLTLNCPGGAQNPHVHLRIGQALFELGEADAAANELATAYRLGGAAILDGEDEKYANFLATRN